MPTPPRRRWFQFGLRTMFVVVTALAVFLGYQANWLRQRRAAFEPRLIVPETQAWMRAESFPSDPVRAPGLLWLFGERGVGDLRVMFDVPGRGTYGEWYDPSPEEEFLAERILKLFPEAEYHRFMSITDEAEAAYIKKYPQRDDAPGVDPL